MTISAVILQHYYFIYRIVCPYSPDFDLVYVPGHFLSLWWHTVSALYQSVETKWREMMCKKPKKKKKKHCDNIKINDKMTLMCYSYTVWWHQIELTAKKSMFLSSLNDRMVILWTIFSARLQTLHPSNDSGTLSVIIKKSTASSLILLIWI